MGSNINRISRVSGKPTVISINGDEVDFKTHQSMSRNWEQLRLQGYKAPSDVVIK